MAISFDHTKNQWINIENQTRVCLMDPDTCGEAGGSVAFWINVMASSGTVYLISTITDLDGGQQSTGFAVAVSSHAA